MTVSRLLNLFRRPGLFRERIELKLSYWGRSFCRLKRSLTFYLVIRTSFFLLLLFFRGLIRVYDFLFASKTTSAFPLPQPVDGNGHVAVVIPNYHGEAYLTNLLASLSRQTYDNLSVLVIDNDSGDKSEDIVKNFPIARWIPMGDNRGFAAAVNRGASEAGDAEFIAFLNNDTIVDPDWAKHQVAALRSDSRLGMVGARIYQKGKEKEINIHCHVLGQDLRSYNIGAGAVDQGQFDDPTPVLGVSGCSMMVRACAFREVGGFDEDFFLCYEDITFSLQMFWLGWDCRIVPQALCYHVSNAHLTTGSPLHIRSILNHDLLWVAKAIPAEVFTFDGVSLFNEKSTAQEIRLFYYWQGFRIIRWRLEGIWKVIRSLGRRRKLYEIRRRPSEMLKPFIKTLSELQVDKLYRIDTAEQYLISKPLIAYSGKIQELFPGVISTTNDIEIPENLSIGSRTTGFDPQLFFPFTDPTSSLDCLEIDITCDQTSWAQFIFYCTATNGNNYFLIGKHFRIVAGRQRYRFHLDRTFFLEDQLRPPPLTAWWQQQLYSIRLDPCEVIGANVILHSLRALMR